MTDVVTAATLGLHAMAWALVHSLWVGGLIWLVVALPWRRVCRRSAGARYLLAYVALLALLAVPVLFGARIVRSYFDHTDWVRRTIARLLEAQPDLAVTDESLWTEILGIHGAGSTLPAPEAAAIGWTLSLVAAAWLGMVSWRLVSLGRAWKNLAYLESIGSEHVSPRWGRLLDGLRARLRIRGAVRLRTTEYVDVPIVFGWRSTTVLLPRRVHEDASPAEAEAVLAHELAHIKRRDYPLNLLQAVAETLLFFHPVARWLSSRIREAREFSTDELACRTITLHWREYGRALA
jgi:beta-lactamase regulating signal transducer with metallopeptidase domain